jgi:uncharacterized membrane protein
MSEAAPVQLIVAAFQSEDGAKEAWKSLKAAKWGGIIRIDRMAIVRRTAKDKVKIRESGDPGGGRGAVFGTIVGGVIGAVAGPMGAVVVGGATGAVVGGLTAKFHDHGIPNERLEKIGEALQPGTSAIVAIIEHKWVAELEKELQEEGANVLTETLSADIAEQLSAGNEVAFSALSTEEGMAVSRVTGNETSMTADTAVITDGGMMIESIAADEDGVTILDLVTDGENVVVAAAMLEAAPAEASEESPETAEGDGSEGEEKPDAGAGIIT